MTKKPRDPQSGPSKREKLLALEQISSQQMNIPGVVANNPSSQNASSQSSSTQHYHTPASSQQGHQNRPKTTNSSQNSNNTTNNFQNGGVATSRTTGQQQHERTYESLDKSLSEMATKTISEATTLYTPATGSAAAAANANSGNNTTSVGKNSVSVDDGMELKEPVVLPQSVLDQLAQMSRSSDQLSDSDKQYLQMIGRWG
jgi:hypothetical protein